MGKISRLDLLKQEKEIVSNLKCLSYSMGEDVLAYYDREINAIEIYKAVNPIYEQEEENDGRAEK